MEYNSGHASSLQLLLLTISKFMHGHIHSVYHRPDTHRSVPETTGVPVIRGPHVYKERVEFP